MLHETKERETNMSKKEVNKISNEDIVVKVSDEVDTFLNKRDWSKYKNSGQYVGYGLLNPVFNRLFATAPDTNSAMFVLMMSLQNFCDTNKYFKDEIVEDTLPK